MIRLTNSCKDKFEEYCKIHSIDLDQPNIHESWVYATLTDFFDSLNCTITLSNVMDDWWYQIKYPETKSLRPEKYNTHKSRYSALKEAFERCNTLINKMNFMVYYSNLDSSSLYQISKKDPILAAELIKEYLQGARNIYLDKPLEQFNIYTRLSLLNLLILDKTTLSNEIIIDLLTHTQDIFISETRVQFIKEMFQRTNNKTIEAELSSIYVKPNTILRSELVYSYEQIMLHINPSLTWITNSRDNARIYRENGYSSKEAILLLQEEFVIHPLENTKDKLNYHTPELGIVDHNGYILGELDEEVLSEISDRWVIDKSEIYTIE